MTLEQLRIFVAVAELEHMTRASQSLNLTQSATSAAIAALESRYATKLFNRIGRRIELTDAGRVFLVEARAVLARATAAETVLSDFAGLSRGSLSLAASQTVGNYWLPPLIHRYQSLHPGIKLGFRIGNTEQVAAWVTEGIADLGVIEGNIDEPALAIQPIADDIAANIDPDKIMIGRPKGLSLSASATDGRQQVASSFRSLAFDTQVWGFDRQAPYNARQSELIRLAADAPLPRRRLARFNLARFYLARDMAAFAADHQRDLALVVELARYLRQHDRLPVADQGARRAHEQARVFRRFRVVLVLGIAVGIVHADAQDLLRCDHRR